MSTPSKDPLLQVETTCGSLLYELQGSLMTAMVRKNLVYKFNHLLKEGNVYVLKNFKVVENSGAFKVIDSNLKIIFTLLTKVEKIDTHVPSIPMHGFQLASEKIVNDRLNDDNILTDIIGCLTVVGDVETVRGGFRKRDLEIISELFANVCPRLQLGVSSGKVKRTVEEEMFENRMNHSTTVAGRVEQQTKRNAKRQLFHHFMYSDQTIFDSTLTSSYLTFKLHLSVRDDTGVVNYVVLHKLAERMRYLYRLKVFDPDYVVEKEYKPVDSTTETILIENLDVIGGTQPCNNATPTTTRKRKFIVNDDEAND
ncbi:hypothetical protein Ccrd_020862 [Cynara cardunculus var. scolymus]|uniref:Replication protein A 70 kDa DNA-binding subunit B/D first OB fold domain-containing protein n=1 Tax=Cynara cardunculus var. scolymus TaxID=59895 RepID=A0A103Y1N2_CYNCS|nr:hypothetical protein Ccrd_020862 [Cynara cardunculus var. scolymus]